ncbi:MULTISPECIES: 3-phenylpropionate/cinnamic acid dioxygenase subunit beta [unclassified Gordonia (in: high G+C Gram-positive bacteria)]|uniref:3-phenylpropionate/cinnamic acid dioxygenase subunit beta n=1 Tax=unclassified Gordonia (in: high G+C Gram-positive bacteria) TaxID=2657482 RepID=UPI0009AD53C6|nr:MULTISPECIES: 3-phenylpropionate/cinnamic acid dioxygenase subunit beta [unclassified Gordonia (in: high G+C Gram-positive bacteria)]MDF3282978.1 3-phenylpropionate/cinnamic acid dioxygenase subunit beta [Gordonia sp. N1V]OPX10767.1 3-phenylpropionate dioxygenase [Gordonia sp. i37]
MTLASTDLSELRGLQFDVEQFLYEEADLLDERRYLEWLDLLHEDISYQIPLRRNISAETPEREFTRAGHDAMWFDEDKTTLTMRVRQLATGEHWAEEPVSRVTHLISNVRLVQVTSEDIEVTSRFVVTRNRVDTETDTFIGRRRDVLVRRDDRWLIRQRVVHLDQSVLLAKSLTIFF